jgi:hypothetical protein
MKIMTIMKMAIIILLMAIIINNNNVKIIKWQWLI